MLTSYFNISSIQNTVAMSLEITYKYSEFCIHSITLSNNNIISTYSKPNASLFQTSILNQHKSVAFKINSSVDKLIDNTPGFERVLLLRGG